MASIAIFGVEPFCVKALTALQHRQSHPRKGLNENLSAQWIREACSSREVRFVENLPQWR